MVLEQLCMKCQVTMNHMNLKLIYNIDTHFCFTTLRVVMGICDSTFCNVNQIISPWAWRRKNNTVKTAFKLQLNISTENVPKWQVSHRIDHTVTIGRKFVEKPPPPSIQRLSSHYCVHWRHISLYDNNNQQIMWHMFVARILMHKLRTWWSEQ